MSRKKPIQLKPCPFCGKDDFLSMWRPPVRGRRERFAVTCTYCGASGHIGEDADEARALWDCRAERTCRDLSDEGLAFVCSECGTRVITGARGSFEANIVDADGHGRHPSFCPVCGARAVRA